MFSGKKVSLSFFPRVFFQCASGPAKGSHSFSLGGKKKVPLSVFLRFKAVLISVAPFLPSRRHCTESPSHGGQLGWFSRHRFQDSVIVCPGTFSDVRLPHYIDTTGDTCGEEPEGREEVVIKDRKVTPAQQKIPGFSISLGWQRARGEGFGAVFYLEFWERELKGALAGVWSPAPPPPALPGRIRHFGDFTEI